ncbi:MAG: imidazolonepropionase [Ignavibacteriales bacterium]
MLTLLINPSQIVTVDTGYQNYKRGISQGQINVLENHSLVIEDGLIRDFIPNASVAGQNFDSILDMKDKTILPGLIDCHTHLAFAGSRADEFRMKISGVTYEEIAQAGGGINKTVHAVRNTGLNELIQIIKPKIEYCIAQGITTLEIKSGYGLNFDDEIKLLKVISYLNSYYDIEIIPTFLGAHTFPPEFEQDQDGYIDLITNKILPYIAGEKLAEFCDGFCEATAFKPEQIDRIFARASSLGMKIKLHSDQFNQIGGVDVALKYNATSIDHLEVVSDKDIKKISETDAVCVLLPGVSFFLHYGYAPARKMISGNAIVALSTDYNPGSSHIANLNLIMSLAAIEMRMTMEEIISAVTINAAKALSVSHKSGSLEIGKNADLAVFNTPEYSDIIYQVGKNLNCCTIKNGKVIYKTIEDPL